MQLLLKKLYKSNVKIDLIDGKLDIKAPVGVITEDILNEIKFYKEDLIEFFTLYKGNNKYVSIPKAPETESYPLTASQSRLWIMSQLEGGSLAYNMPGAIKLKGVIDANKLEESFRILISRHEILRTSFKTDKQGDIRQYIIPIEQLDFRITKEDYCFVENHEEAIASYIEEKNKVPFNLEQAPLVRSSLIKIKEEEYVFFLLMHHIVGDGWSMELLMSEVVRVYNALTNGKEADLPELGIQYKDYAVWLNGELQQEKQQASEQYWLQQFEGELPVLELPSFKARPSIQTYNGANITHHFSQVFLEKLKDFSKEQDVTLFMTLMAGINVLLHKYSGQDDIIVGTPIAGREHPDLENQLGLYLNTLAIRTQIKDENSFLDLVSAQKVTLLAAYEHQGYPFDALVGKLNLERDTSRSVLFDVLVVLQSQGQLKNLNNETVASLEVSDYNFSAKTSKLDISFNFMESDGLDLTITYNTDIYDAYLIERMFSHFENLVTESLKQPERLVREVVYLTTEEQNQLLLEFNNTEVDYPKDKTIIDLFDEQVEKNPNSVALVFEDIELTYKELDDKSNQLSYYLQERGVGLESKVILCFDDFIDLQIVGLLGIIKSGAIYVPIEPDYPQERIQHIIDDTKAEFIITSANYSDIFATNNNVLLLDQFNFNEEISGEKNRICQNNICNIIYTSGSTGTPKGVLVSHGNLVDYLFGLSARIKIEENNSLAMMSTISTDSGSTVLFSALIFGKTIHMFSKNSLRDIYYIRQYFTINKIDCIKIVPPYWAILNEDDKMPIPERMIIFGGEELTNEVVEAVIKRDPNVILINHYGPTEATIGKLLFVLDGIQKGRNIPIGKSFSNTKIYVLDKNMEICPIGVKGELFIGGDGVAKGYLNNAKLTEEKFVENCIVKGQGKLYKTGDLVVMLPDGNIEFKGRIDNQVKILGHRIELGEIERVINEFPMIKTSVVLVKSDNENSKVIVAYIITEKTINKESLRNYLQSKLPGYMIPKYYIELEKLPLTPMGKINRKVLPGADGEDLIKNEYVAPRSKEEKLLVSVWEDVLKRDSISIKDSFYNLGGDSIKSIQIAARLKQHGYTLKIQHILQVPVLEQLTKYLEVSTRTIDQSIVTGAVDFTPVQRYFFEDPIFKVHHHFNQSVVLKSKEALSHNFLAKSIAALMEQHDVLRMVYKKQEGNWMQFNQDLSSSDTPVAFYDLREEENGLEVMADLGAKLQSGFDLEAGPLLKVGHFRLKDGDRLALIIHHLVVDGVSWRILLEDLSTLYAQCAAGENLKLPLKTDSFQRWASLQKEYAYGDNQKSEKPYWENICSESVPAFPMDMEKQESSIKMDSSVSFSLDESITELLQTQVHGAYNTEINDVLLTGLGLAIKDTFGLDKSVVRMEGHGREDIIADVDISRTVGWFTSAYPFVLNLADSKSAITSLIEVKEDLRRIPNKGIGYGIQKYLSDGFNDVPQNSIEFNYLGDFGYNVSNKSDSFFEYSSENIGSSVASEIESDAILSISGMLVSGQLTLSIRFSKELHHLKTIENFADSYQKNLVALITELSVIKENQLTPSDLTFKGLGVEDLSRLKSDNALEDVYKLSPLQQGIYYHWLSGKSTSMYFEQMSYRVKSSDLDVQSTHESYDKLVSRHGVLRTSFTYDLNDQPLQIVRKTVPSNFSYKKMPEGIEAHDYVEEVKLKDREKGFDLETPCQMRLQILDLGNDEFEFIWSHHHILTDGWCMSILIKDFYQILSAVHQKSPLNLSKPLPYSNYIQWLDKVNTNDSIAYWKGYLEGYSHEVEIPFKTGTTGDEIYMESKESVTIDGDLYANLNKLCGQIGVTQNTFIQAVWGYLLSSYNSTQDVVFGSVVSGRPEDLEGVEDMIGLFINTIPVRIRYNDGDTPLDLLRQIQNEAISNKAHHYLNLSEVQSQSELGMNLIDHIMVFENYPVQDMVRENMENGQSQQGQELKVESIDVFEQTNYDFNIAILPSSSSLIVEFKYNSNKYDIQRIKNISNHIVNLVEQFIDSKDNSLSSLTYLAEQEEHQLLVEFNDTEAGYPKDKTVIDLFEEQVKETPNNIAIVFEEKELTYEELNEKSNQLANYLRENYSIKANDLVGIKLDRSERMITAILGILKSGAAYVPIDVNYPQERINYIEQDSQCKVVLDEAELEIFAGVQGKYSNKNIEKVNTSSDLAYVIYTSGTTGNPKGVMVEHKNVVRLLKNDNPLFDFNSNDVWSMFHSYCFDFSVWEMYGALLNGGKLIIIPLIIAKDPTAFLEILSKQRVTILNQTPSAFYNLSSEELKKVEANLQLRYVIFGGEALSPGNLIDYKDKYPMTKLVNMYGITETTVHVTYKEITSKEIENNISNIGKPIPTLSCYVLDQNQNLLPIGISGELYVGGDGVARGYLNRPALTRERFIENPFKEGHILYRSGDNVRMLNNGELEYLGRKDQQVKIRGFRIELGEIESVILQYSEDLKQVIVEAKKVNEEMVLIAYFTSTEIIDKSELRSFLLGKLPDYMVPGFYVELDELPLTSNGKIDRKALPGVDGDDLIRNEYVSPRNETEEKLAVIWQEVLGVERVGVTDNFFELGGHSLIVAQVINRTHKQLGKTIAFKTFFANPTIEGLSKEMHEDQYMSIPKAPETESYPLTASQSRLWIMSQLDGGSLAYNMPGAITLKGRVDANKFEESFRLLIHRHEILRTCIKTNNEGDIRQYIIPIEQLDFKISREDYSFVENQEVVLASYIEEKNKEPFDLEQAPLVRASLIKLKEDESVFFLSQHHIVGDGWSMELLISEVVKTYNALTQGKEVDLPELSIQYKDYAVWLNGELQQEKQQASEQYWLQQFAGELPVLELPSFKTRPLVQTYNGANITHHFSQAFLEKLKDFSKAHDVTLFMTLVAGTNTLLHKYTGQKDIIVGTPIAGREHPDLENQIGLYLNTLAIRTQFNEGNSFVDLVSAQKETLLSAYEHQSYPFDALVGKLDLKRDTSRSALFDVLVALQNQGQLNNLRGEELINLEVSNYDFSNETAKFDISFNFVESEGLDLAVSYNTDIYDAYLIERIFVHFENLLTELVKQPEILIGEVAYLTPEEQNQLLSEFNDTEVDYPKDKTIIELFEEQVEKTPNSIAFVFAETELTYRELNEKSNQLGSYLRENYSITAGNLVGIKLDRSERMIIAIFGVLKSGAAYVPIDVNYPQERIDYMEKDSNSKVVIDKALLAQFDGVQDKYSKENIKNINQPTDLAYVMYTSGSTGIPKGVMVEHRNVIRLVKPCSYFPLNEASVVLSTGSVSFDATVFEFFGTLLNGARFIFTNQNNLLELSELVNITKTNKVNSIFMTTSWFNEVLVNNITFFENISQLMVGGDVVSPTHILKVIETYPDIKIANVYGPTENTTFSTTFDIKDKKLTNIPIGKPIPNTQAYILDEALQLLPIGVTGKLYLAGGGLARGYLNKAELTAEKFIPHPFIAGERMYDTGDLGRWLPDGNIEFVGRKDHQVKIRGFRIELGEIENSISQYSEDLQQVVVLAKAVNDEKVLIAYFTSSEGIDKSELRSFLQGKLPDYMVPSFYVELDELPVTPNGKIDRKALPGVDGKDLIRNEYVAPRNETEEKLAAIWQEVLGVERVGVTDNFFELGGHSLKAVKLLNEVEKIFQFRMPVSEFFANPNIESFSSVINMLKSNSSNKNRKSIKIN